MREVAVDIGFVNEAQRSDLVTVRLQEHSVAELGVKPAELDKEPRVARDQVIFQIDEVVVIAEPVAEDGMALKSQESRRAPCWMMGIGSGRQRQSREQMVVAGRANDDVDWASGLAIGGMRDASGLIDDMLG